MKKIYQILMERDGLPEAEAREAVENARDEFNAMIEAGNVIGAESICQDHFGLEPDYLDEFLF